MFRVFIFHSGEPQANARLFHLRFASVYPRVLISNGAFLVCLSGILFITIAQMIVAKPQFDVNWCENFRSNDSNRCRDSNEWFVYGRL